MMKKKIFIINIIVKKTKKSFFSLVNMFIFYQFIII